jgi:hypothetical protein
MTQWEQQELEARVEAQGRRLANLEAERRLKEQGGSRQAIETFSPRGRRRIRSQLPRRNWGIEIWDPEATAFGLQASIERHAKRLLQL